jgi:DNA-binding NarL/FixJ family response regulator
VCSYRVLLADDHVMFRQGIKRILKDAASLEVVGEVADGLKLLDLVQELLPNMVILDISMPGLRGIEATGEIRTIHPDVEVLILTMHKDKGYLYHALAAGAKGYLLKEDADTELFSAIETIRQGGIYISPLLSLELMDDLAQVCHEGCTPHLGPLSAREREVLKLVAEGKSSKEVADLLCISVRTVQHHRASIMAKLKIRKTADLVRYALREGYV